MEGAENTIKANVSIGSASISVEGDKETVNAQIERFYAVFGKEGAHAVAGTPGGQDKESGKARTASGRARKAGGPSCASRIEALIPEKFFDGPQTPKTVLDRLAEKATPYPTNHVAASLTDMVKRGKLRRMKQGAVWVYVKP